MPSLLTALLVCCRFCSLIHAIRRQIDVGALGSVLENTQRSSMSHKASSLVNETAVGDFQHPPAALSASMSTSAPTSIVDQDSSLRVFLAGLSHATDKKRCDNFRHQADTISMYGILRNRGVPANAITIVYGGSQRECHDIMSIKARTALRLRTWVEIFEKQTREEHPDWSDENISNKAQELAELKANSPQPWWQSWINYEEGLRLLDADVLAPDGDKPRVWTGSEVTVDNVLKALRQSVQSRHDDLFIYIATHGSAPTKTNGAKAGSLQVATPLPSGGFNKDSIPSPILLATIGGLMARRTFVFTQVCFSGAMWAAPQPPVGKPGVQWDVFFSSSTKQALHCQAFAGSYRCGDSQPHWNSRPIAKPKKRGLFPNTRAVGQVTYAEAYKDAFKVFEPPNVKDIVAFSAAPWHLEAAGGLASGSVPSYSSTASLSFQQWLLENPCPDEATNSGISLRDLFEFINEKATEKGNQVGCGFETSGCLGTGSQSWFGTAMSALPVFAFTCPFGAGRDEEILKLTAAGVGENVNACAMPNYTAPQPMGPNFMCEES